MAAVTLLAEQLRGNVTAGPLPVNAGVPRHIQIKMTSPVFGTDPGLTFDLQIEQSFDGGVNFVPWFGGSSQGGSAGTIFRGVTSDGLAAVTGSFDGQARVIQGRIVTNQPFVYGLTGEALAT